MSNKKRYLKLNLSEKERKKCHLFKHTKLKAHISIVKKIIWTRCNKIRKKIFFYVFHSSVLTFYLEDVLFFDKHFDQNIVKIIRCFNEKEVLQSLQAPTSQRRQTHQQLGKSSRIVLKLNSPVIAIF